MEYLNNSEYDLGVLLKREMIDTNNYIINGKTKLSGEDFCMLIHVMNGYGTGKVENKPLIDSLYKEEGKTYYSTSLITQDFLGHVSNSTVQEQLIFGFTNITPDMYVSSAPYDMYSFAENGSYNISYEISPKNIEPTKTAQQTIHRHNEFVLKRKNTEGQILSPTCIVNFNEISSEYQIQAAQFYQLPILTIDSEKYMDLQKQKINILYKDILSNSNGSITDFLYSLTAYVYGFSYKNNNFTYKDNFLSFDKIPVIIEKLLEEEQIKNNYSAIKDIELFVNDNPSNRNYTVLKELRENLNMKINDLLMGQDDFIRTLKSEVDNSDIMRKDYLIKGGKDYKTIEEI